MVAVSLCTALWHLAERMQSLQHADCCASLSCLMIIRSGMLLQSSAAASALPLNLHLSEVIITAAVTVIPAAYPQRLKSYAAA